MAGAALQDGREGAPAADARLAVVPRSLLFSAVRNEGPFLLEWIAYHRMIGFDRVAIVSNDCTDGTDLLLDALAAQGVVHHIATTVPEGARPQANAGRLASRHGLLEAGDWALWLDADEFLNVHVGTGGLADLVSALGSRRGIVVPWRVFGDGGNLSFPGRHVHEAFSGASDGAFAANREVKTLFRAGEGIAGFARLGINRPLLASGHSLSHRDFLAANGRPLSSASGWTRRWLKAQDSGRTNLAATAEFGWDLAQINHYCIRTPEHFRLKRLRGRGYAQRGADRPRHTDAFYQRMNRNDCKDRSILRHQRRVDAEMARLLALPAVAEAAAEVARRVAAQLRELELAEGAPPVGSPAPLAALEAPAPAARPGLTLPPAEAERLRAALAEAAVILEYGSGGSTVLASELPGRTVFSVESDAGWCAKMQAWFEASPGLSPVTLHHADIGPTKAWGRPKDMRGLARWPDYALSVWERPDFRHPDLVLIDGRFRPACFFATLFRIARPVTLLWDDYLGRPEYHHVERFAAPVATHGRMAEFRLAPQSLPGERLGQVVAAFLDPQ